jgi:hypothetical protein
MLSTHGAARRRGAVRREAADAFAVLYNIASAASLLGAPGPPGRGGPPCSVFLGASGAAGMTAGIQIKRF